MLETELSQLQEEYSTFPPGKLLIVKNGNYIKWFNRNNKTNTYITKKDKSIAEKLASKKYLSAQITDLSREICAIKSYLQILGESTSTTDQLLQNPSLQELLTGNNSTLSLEDEIWSSKEYIRNPKHPEQLIYKSIDGTYMRSKSETIIHATLLTNNISCRYEDQLILSGIEIYPDFTFIHPLTQKIVYWEHFGLIDDPKYRKKFLGKMNTYTSNGIYPSINLITSFETQDNPFTSYDSERLLKHFLGL